MGLETITFAAHPGPQTDFLASEADIAIYGGPSGCGGTWALVYAAVLHSRPESRPGSGNIIFGRHRASLTAPGGLRDRVHKFCEATGGSVDAASLDEEWNTRDYRGAGLSFIGFDDLTEFTESQFWTMLGRNRTTRSQQAITRATAKPDPSSWVRELIDWWIDKDGLPIPDRAGVLRWFVRTGRDLCWGDTREEAAIAANRHPRMARSLTFIPAKLEDNPSVDGEDLLSGLRMLTSDDQRRLIDGNWNVPPGRLHGGAWPRDISDGLAIHLGPGVEPQPTEIDSAEFLAATPAGSCRRVVEVDGSSSLTFEDDRKAPADAGASELAKLEAIVGKMVNGCFGAGKFMIGAHEVYVVDPRYTNSTPQGLTVSVSTTPREHED